MGLATLGAEGGTGVAGAGPSFAGQGSTAETIPKRRQAMPAEDQGARQGERVGALLQGVSRPMNAVSGP